VEVILLDKVENLGSLGEKVSVRSGYGRNFLIPQGKAVPATAENLAEFEKRRAEYEAQVKDELQKAEIRKSRLNGQRFEVRARAGEEGKLFGSVGTTDIVDALVAAGHEIERKEVRMPDTGPIHELGEYEIGIHLHTDIDATVTIAVVAEE